MPEVGCVVITRDRPASAVRAIRSAMAQTIAPAELVVVDDGSFPALLLPADLEADPRVRLIRLDPPRGRGAARNVGIRLIEAPLVAFLDDDDVWHPDKTKIQLAALEAAPVAALGTGFRVWSDPISVEVPPTRERMPRAVVESYGLCPSTVVANRAALLEVGGFAEDLERCEDWDLWLRLSDHHRLEGIPDVLVERDDSGTSPVELHAAYLVMRERLRPRVARLTRAERWAVERIHDWTEGVHCARIGRRRRATMLVLRAWARRPWAPRPLVQLGRIALGERRWLRVLRAVAAYRAGSSRSTGVPVPAPVTPIEAST